MKFFEKVLKAKIPGLSELTPQSFSKRELFVEGIIAGACGVLGGIIGASYIPLTFLPWEALNKLMAAYWGFALGCSIPLSIILEAKILAARMIKEYPWVELVADYMIMKVKAFFTI